MGPGNEVKNSSQIRNSMNLDVFEETDSVRIFFVNGKNLKP